MRIDRNNYEEFFILYVDNELTDHERRLVEEFVQKHPDLEEELVMLEQTKILPDPGIVFEKKEQLIKETLSIISLANYEEMLLLYCDNELNKEEKTAVDTFVSHNPDVKKELDLLLRSRLQPEPELVFHHKEVLYRTEEKTKIIRLPWWRIAAAAVLILAAGTLTFTILNQDNKPAITNPVAGTKKPGETIPPVNTKTETNESPKVVEEKNQNTIAESAVKIKPVTKRNIVITTKKPDNVIIKPEEEKNLVIQESNNLPDPAPRLKTDVVNTPVEFENKSEYSHPSTKINVTERPAVAYYITDASENKTKRFRGFLRKATRILERHTNITATDENDRLLIAGLAVKL